MLVASQLAALRKEKGWSQAELARRAGLSPSTIAMYETGRRSPDDETLRRLNEVLDAGVQRDESDLTPITEAETKAETKADAFSTEHEDTSSPLQLQVSGVEARVLLAMRMNPDIMKFVVSYITATDDERARLERTWQVILSFQSAT